VVVVDANVALSWVLKDSEEAHLYSASVAEAGALGEQLIAPSVLPAECSYVLLKEGRKGKWGAVKTAEFAEVIGLFPIDLYVQSATLAENVRFALLHNVSGFDAYYLALAMRTRARLATLDRGLKSAARAAGVELFTA